MVAKSVLSRAFNRRSHRALVRLSRTTRTVKEQQLEWMVMVLFWNQGEKTRTMTKHNLNALLLEDFQVADVDA